MADSIMQTPSSNIIRLRPVQPEDEAFLAAVYGSTRERELAMVPWTNEQRETFIRLQCTAQLQHYRTEYPQAEHSIILFDEQPVGRIYLDRREKEFRILDITLLPAFRGHGIGTPLIRRVMDEAARVGKMVGIQLDFYGQSQRLFERLGFKPDETNGFHTLFLWNP